jgi:hypothetical protein
MSLFTDVDRFIAVVEVDQKLRDTFICQPPDPVYFTFGYDNTPAHLHDYSDDEDPEGEKDFQWMRFKPEIRAGYTVGELVDALSLAGRVAEVEEHMKANDVVLFVRHEDAAA